MKIFKNKVVKNYALVFVENQCKERFWPTPD